MVSKKSERPSRLLMIGGATMVFTMGVGVGLVAHGRSSRPVSGGDRGETVAQTEREERSVSAPAREPEVGSSRRAPNEAAEEAARRRSETEHKARMAVDSLTRELLQQAQANERYGIEAVGHSMTPYLTGMMTGLRHGRSGARARDGRVLAERTCSHPQSDVELMMVSQMVFAAPAELGTSRTFECGLRGRKKEDVPLWEMIDAWRVSGQAMPQAIAEMQASATDERTKQRLSNYEQATKERLAAAEQQPGPQVPSVTAALKAAAAAAGEDTKPRQ